MGGLLEKKSEVFRYNAFCNSLSSVPKQGEKINKYNYILADSSHFIPLDPFLSSAFFFRQYTEGGPGAHPIHLCLHTINACNDNCPWCYSRGARLKFQNVSPPVDHESLLNDVFNRSTIMAVYFSGLGEPTLLPGFNKILLRKGETKSKQSPALSVVTNGSHLEVIDDPSVLSAVRLLRISMNAYDEKSFRLVHRPSNQQDSYAKRMERIEDVLRTVRKNKTKTIVGIHYTIDAVNHRGVEDFISQVSKIRPDYVQFAMVRYLKGFSQGGDFEESMSKRIEELSVSSLFPIINFTKRKRYETEYDGFCWFKYKPNVYPDGQIYVCPLMPDHENEWSRIGNVADGFVETWEKGFPRVQERKSPACSCCPFNTFNRIYSWLFARFQENSYNHIYKVLIRDGTITKVLPR